MNKKLTTLGIVVIIVVSLTICWFIGEYSRKVFTEKNETVVLFPGDFYYMREDSHKFTEDVPEGYRAFWLEIREESAVSLTYRTDSITFGDNIGRIFWEKGYMEFEGDAKESAKIFFEDGLKPYIDEYIKSELEKKELVEIPEMILFRHVTSGEWSKEFKPTVFLDVVNTDLSKCFIDSRLRINLNGEIYWIRLEED